MGSRLDSWMVYRKLVWGETDAFERVCLSLLDMDMRGLGVELCMIIGLVHVRIRV